MSEQWTAVVPIRPWWMARDALGPTPERRAMLSRAIALDTLEAIAKVEAIATVIVVTAEQGAIAFARRLGMEVMRDRPLLEADPLNRAAELGVRWAGGRHPDRSVVVVPGDLPSSTAESLEDALGRLAPHPAAFVTDARGRGATLVATRVPGDFRGRFGPSSGLAFSRSGYRAVVDADARVRHDVDEARDLDGLGALGVGPRTERAAAEPVPRRRGHRALAG